MIFEFSTTNKTKTKERYSHTCSRIIIHCYYLTIRLKHINMNQANDEKSCSILFKRMGCFQVPILNKRMGTLLIL